MNHRKFVLILKFDEMYGVSSMEQCGLSALCAEALRRFVRWQAHCVWRNDFGQLKLVSLYVHLSTKMTQGLLKADTSSPCMYHKASYAVGGVTFYVSFVA